MKLYIPPRQLQVVLLATLVLAGCDWMGGEPPAVPMMAVQVVEAQRTDVPLSFEMVGGTLGNQDVPIRARVEGFLETRDFQEGTFVKKGDRVVMHWRNVSSLVTSQQSQFCRVKRCQAFVS